MPPDLPDRQINGWRVLYLWVAGAVRLFRNQPKIIVKVLNFAMLDDEERTDLMVKIFPKVTKCTFHNSGASGTIQQ